MPNPGDTAAPPEYKLYRTRPKLLQRGSGDGGSMLDDLRGAPKGDKPPRRRRRITVGRVVMWLAVALVGWIALSVALFLISAAVQQDQVSSDAEAQLDGGGVGLDEPADDADPRLRPAHREDAGAGRVDHRARAASDSILLMRFGGGHSAKLSIPRDTVVDIPGHGPNKINAAYALGGAALTIQTVEQYLGIDVDHLFEVNFANFPDADRRDGRHRLHRRLRRLAHQRRLPQRRLHAAPDAPARRTSTATRRSPSRARARTSATRARTTCTRARRQQKILAAMKGQRVLARRGFLRLPLISWNAPKSVQSDMGGPRLLGYAIGMARQRRRADARAQAERRDAPARRRRRPRRSPTPSGRRRSPASWRGSIGRSGLLDDERLDDEDDDDEEDDESDVFDSRPEPPLSEDDWTTTSPSCPRRPCPSARARGCGASCRSRCCRSPCP